MALDIPNVTSGMDNLLKGLDTGSSMIHNMMLNKYYSTLHPSGDVANAMYVEQLRQQFGENDPRYLQAKKALQMGMDAKQSLMDYRGILGDTAGIRYTSPLGKEIAEGKGQGAQDILNNRRKGGASGAGSNSGYSYDANGNNVVATPDEVDQVANGGNGNPRSPEEQTAYERSINKKTSDAQARNTLIRAENLDKTRNSINVDDLTRYSGLKGTAKWLYESKKALEGNPSDEFLAHQQAINAATLMADQMRQFYGDSIQPSAMDRLRHLANPATWYKDPKVAQAQWQQLNKILDTETQTYRDKATSPIRLNKLDYKNGQFVMGKGKQGATQKESNESAGDGSYDLSAVEKDLTKIDPKYTAANIRATAKQRGITTDQVVYQLYQRMRAK